MADIANITELAEAFAVAQTDDDSAYCRMAENRYADDDERAGCNHSRAICWLMLSNRGVMRHGVDRKGFDRGYLAGLTADLRADVRAYLREQGYRDRTLAREVTKEVISQMRAA